MAEYLVQLDRLGRRPPRPPRPRPTPAPEPPGGGGPAVGGGGRPGGWEEAPDDFPDPIAEMDRQAEAARRRREEIANAHERIALAERQLRWIRDRKAHIAAERAVARFDLSCKRQTYGQLYDKCEKRYHADLARLLQAAIEESRTWAPGDDAPASAAYSALRGKVTAECHKEAERLSATSKAALERLQQELEAERREWDEEETSLVRIETFVNRVLEANRRVVAGDSRYTMSEEVRERLRQDYMHALLGLPSDVWEWLKSLPGKKWNAFWEAIGDFLADPFDLGNMWAAFNELSDLVGGVKALFRLGRFSRGCGATAAGGGPSGKGKRKGGSGDGGDAPSGSKKAPGKKPTPRLKDSDFGPKIEDAIPRRGVPKNWSKSDIENAIIDYQTSIASRKAEQRAFELAGKGSEIERLAHARRIAEEERFLHSLRDALENRK
ncbi:MAG: hypothetical protein ACYTG0_24430 [Planctomycetota bacterium]|jgi:hypothetical protein